jgi:hypothetical protein
MGYLEQEHFGDNHKYKGHGGLLVYVRSGFGKSITCVNSESRSILWLYIVTQYDRIMIGLVYYAPDNKKAENKEQLLDLLHEEKLHYSAKFNPTIVLICGDMNARTGEQLECPIQVTIGRDTLIEPPGFSIPNPVSQDVVVNTREKLLLDFCAVNNLNIVNGGLERTQTSESLHVRRTEELAY